jgi:hypothetical protein
MSIEYSDLEKRNQNEALKHLTEQKQKEAITREIKKIVGIDPLTVVRGSITIIGGVLTIAAALAVHDSYVSPTEPLPTKEIAALIGGLVVLSFGVSLKRK